MAQFKITSKLEGLSPSEAADYSRRYPYDDKGPRIDGDAYNPDQLDLFRRTLITPDNKIWSISSAMTAFDDPRTGSVVKSWEKRYAKQVRKDREGWKGDIRLKADGSDGPEYDRYLLTLSKDDAARLGEDGIHRTFVEFINALRESPFGSGNRMVEVEPIHQTSEDGHIHLHVMVHRHAFDATERLVRRTVFQPEIHEKEAARIAGAISADITMEYIKGMGRGISEEAREEAVEAIREAGGEPSPELAGTREQVAEWKQPDAEQARIEQALREIERRMARREEEKRSDASLYTDLQNGLAAVREREGLKATIAEHEREIERLTGVQTGLETDLGAARDEIETLTGQLTESVALVAEKLEQVETLTGDLNEARQQLAQTDAALEQERAGRAADVKKAAESEAELKDQIAKVTKWLDDEQHARKAEAEAAAKVLEQAQKATQEATDALKIERDTFLDRATAWANENVRAPLMSQVETLKEELAEARRSFAAEMAEAQRQFMSQIRELTASIRPQQAEQAAPSRQRQQWPTWARKSFSELSSAERTAMEKALATEIEKGRQQQGLRLSDFHKIVNDRWREQQAAASEQDAGMKPKKP